MIVLHRRHAKLVLVLWCLALFVGGLILCTGFFAMLSPWPWLEIAAAVAVLVPVLGVLMHAIVAWMMHGRRRGAPAPQRPAHAIELTCAASWPRRVGHGTALWEELVKACASAGRPVIAVAVDPTLAAAYASRSNPPGTVTGNVVIWSAMPGELPMGKILGS